MEHGANIHALNCVKVDVFQAALYGKQYKHLQLIHDLGHTVEKYGGQAFRNAITDRNYKVLDFFINNGVEINYNKPDSDFISIDFLPLIDTIPFKVGRRNLLRLSKELGEYNDWQIVWDPKSKKIAYYDTEHQELRELCKFDEFMADMAGQLENLF